MIHSRQQIRIIWFVTNSERTEKPKHDLTKVIKIVDSKRLPQGCGNGWNIVFEQEVPKL